jgi:hypothetical protein
MMEVRHAAAFVDIKVHERLKLFAFVVFRNVLLHLWRLFRASPAWKIAGHARWKNAFRCNLSRSLAGDGCGHGNSQSDAISVARPAGSSESLDEYRIRRGIQRDHDGGDQRWLALLYPFRIDRNHPDGIYRLVRVDLAEAANPLIAIISIAARHPESVRSTRRNH